MKTNEEIYRDYHDKVYGYIISRIKNHTVAEDLAADVFLKVFEKIQGYDETLASVSTWIYTITRNTLIDYYRTNKNFEQVPETLKDSSSVEESVCNNQMLEMLANALEKLEARERNIIIQRYYNGKSLKEISENMNISYAYVKVLQSNAMEKIKKFIEK